MSDIMRPMPFAHLMNWILSEYRAQGSVFGVSKLVRHADGKSLPIFEEKIESPYGPAAGPHTQLAQNIIAAYAAGSRFFEVKTVQVMDGEELSKCVSKPCITAADECYNCEWSTELYVPQAFAEYVKAWFACKLLAKELELGDPDGFVFNMSVGYDLKGIQSPKVDAYIEGMKDASGTEVWQECMDWALANLDRFEKVDEAYVRGITPHVSNSITESTLHGCPPDEIERIATYLITEKNLNTYVKCNPTLLGYEFARKTLDGLGYDYIQFDDHHFREDLQWEDAVPMFHRLMQRTGERGLEFGVKITNTFPVDVAAGELPSEEMYMSGRSLYPLSLSLAARLAREFKGKLRISYSGGADIHSVRALFDAGIWPITMATTVLKPGGYQRFSQIGQALADISYEPWEGVDAAGAAALAEGISADGHYQKPMKPIPSRKLDKKVPLIDCFSAPCRSGCPIEQDIPAYLMKVGEGKYEEALRIITQRNALPFITGTICSHRCQDKCMRNAYEESVYIRTQKLKAAEGGFEALLPKLRPAAPAAGRRVAVVGGGPGGMSAAYFLSRSGVDVTVFERRDALGGIVRHVIPGFRIPGEAIDNDVRLMEAMGVKVELNTEVKNVQELFAQGFTHVILATGAWQKGRVRRGAQRHRVPGGRQEGPRYPEPGPACGGHRRRQHRHGRRPGRQAPSRRGDRLPGVPQNPPLYARRPGGAGAGPGRRRGVPGAARPRGRPGRRAHLQGDGAGRPRRHRPPLPRGHRPDGGGARRHGDHRRGREGGHGALHRQRPFCGSTGPCRGQPGYPGVLRQARLCGGRRPEGPRHRGGGHRRRRQGGPGHPPFRRGRLGGAEREPRLSEAPGQAGRRVHRLRLL